MSDAADIPEFPVPDFTQVDAAFGARIDKYIPKHRLPPAFSRMTHPMCRVASALFYNGGRLADHGLRLKPGISAGQAMLALSALLRSFEPSHEVKIGTVGVALANWTEPTQTAGAAHV